MTHKLLHTLNIGARLEHHDEAWHVCLAGCERKPVATDLVQKLRDRGHVELCEDLKDCIALRISDAGRRALWNLMESACD